MIRDELAARLGDAYASLPEEAAAGLPVYRGKVRDVVAGSKSLLLVASDRLSAFDRVLALVPFKGEILTRISSWWFERCSDIVPNHLEPGGSPEELAGTGRAMLVRKAEMLPLEVVVRGYLAGSAWRDYSAGKAISGISLPEGLSRDEKFPVPLVTPSLKMKEGHDRPISRDEILAGKVASPELWAEVEAAALALFRRGQELAARNGLVLVDTKYEFGLVEGKLVIADEIHSPDSSRYWYADSYLRRLEAGEEQKALDKEPFRRWLMDRGFSGEGEAPAIPDEVLLETAWRYIQAYETITGENFIPRSSAPQAETRAIARVISERLVQGLRP